MKSTTEKAVAALEMLPEDMREQAVAYLIEQAEKFALQELVAELKTLRPVACRKWGFESFLYGRLES